MENNKTLFRNGVDLKRLAGTIRSVSADPALGQFTFRLTNEWVDGGLNRSAIKGFYGGGKEDDTRTKSFNCANDEPDILLGKDQAPNPVEYVLHALAGCLTTSLVYHAAARGYVIEKVRSHFEGELDLRGLLGINGAPRNGYRQIRVRFDIQGNFTEEEKQEILKLGPAYSPVFDIVSNPVPVDVQLAVETVTAEPDC